MNEWIRTEGEAADRILSIDTWTGMQEAGSAIILIFKIKYFYISKRAIEMKLRIA